MTQIHPIIRDLNARRQELGMTQVEMAHHAQTNQGYVSQILNGVVNPSLPVLDRLLKTVGLRLVLAYGATPLDKEEKP